MHVIRTSRCSPGILLVVTPRPEATLEVTETVLLDTATRSLTVRPPDFSAAGAILSAEKPYASKVRIAAGGRPVQFLDGIVNRSQTLALDEPARPFEMRYELNRAVARSKPSTTGRALGAIRPLTSGVPETMAVAVVAVGDAVLNLSCPGLAVAEQAVRHRFATSGWARTCLGGPPWSSSSSIWTADLRVRSPRI